MDERNNNKTGEPKRCDKTPLAGVTPDGEGWPVGMAPVTPASGASQLASLSESRGNSWLRRIIRSAGQWVWTECAVCTFHELPPVSDGIGNVVQLNISHPPVAFSGEPFADDGVSDSGSSADFSDRQTGFFQCGFQVIVDHSAFPP